MNRRTAARVGQIITTSAVAASLAAAAWAKKPAGPPSGGGDPTPTHTLVSLGTFNSGAWAEDIDEFGRVVVNADGRAYLIVPRDENPVDGVPDTWFKDEGSPSNPNEPDGINDLMIDLGVMDGVFPNAASHASGINSAGQIVGYSNVGLDGYERAFLITPVNSNGAQKWFADDFNGGNALMIDVLGDLRAGDTLEVSASADVSDTGYVVGVYLAYEPIEYSPWIVAPERDVDGVPHTWFKDMDTNGINDLMINLGTTDPVNLPSGYATDVTTDGWVMGCLMNRYGTEVAWFLVIPEDTDSDGFPDVWYKDEEDLPDGANDLMFELPYRPNDLNDSGQVLMGGAVWQIDPVTKFATLLYELEEVPTSMGEFQGGGGLNTLGGVVGSAYKRRGNNSTGDHTPLYWQDGVLYNLFDLMTNDDGIQSADATVIDDENRILVGAVVNDQREPFVAVPISPAP